MGGLEAILASLGADMAVAAYLSQAIPDSLDIVHADVGLPALPKYHINLRMPAMGSSTIALELAGFIRRGAVTSYIRP